MYSSRRPALNSQLPPALARFQARAERVAKAMGRRSYRLVQIHINDGHHRPMPVARGMMLEAKADVAPAHIEAGTQTLSVTVNGETMRAMTAYSFFGKSQPPRGFVVALLGEDHRLRFQRQIGRKGCGRRSAVGHCDTHILPYASAREVFQVFSSSLMTAS